MSIFRFKSNYCEYSEIKRNKDFDAIKAIRYSEKFEYIN